MTCRNQHRIFRVVQQLVLAGAMVFLASAAQAQTYNIIHNFAGRDGSGPSFGLTSDRAGNLYGTTELGGTHCGDSGCGTVFEMVRHGANWILKQLYDFAGGTDGEFPLSGVIFGADGNLYGATNAGGQYGDGIYQEYHSDYHVHQDDGSVVMRNHVGTANGTPFQVPWNTQWIPDQAPGGIKLIARIRDNNG